MRATSTKSAVAILGLLSLCAAGSGCASGGKEEPGQWPSVPADAESLRPFELALEAFQVGDRLLLVARGRNSTAGFTMRLERRGRGEIVLRNVPPSEAAAQVVTPFELRGWFPADGRPEMIHVHVGSATEDVVVRKAERLFESS